ncbi:MAG: hypothetical protein M3042_09780, partial [Actinomycetota bacterium]|nr:hypothetical protein [Actinomycetota bacterium]
VIAVGGITAGVRAAPAASGDVRLAPRGWRWESYGGVQLTVPATWKWGVTGSPWCTSDKPQLPTVGRQGPVWAVRCATTEPPVALRAAHAWLQPAREPSGLRRDVGAGWREYRRSVAGVQLDVLDNQRGQAERILASLQPVRRVDQAGCRTTAPVIADRQWRPHAAPISQVATQPITTVSICRYQLPGGGMPSPPAPLLASSRLSQSGASQLARVLAGAPPGGGPDTPQDCIPQATLGDEVIVVTIRAETATSQVVVRYSGCSRHGMDDGHQRRRLTRPALQYVLAGPNMPFSLSDAVWRLENR